MALTPESQKALMDILKVKQPESIAAPIQPKIGTNPLTEAYYNYIEGDPLAQQVSGGDPLKKLLRFASEFVPGINTELAQRRGDKVGEALSYLDALGAASLPIKASANVATRLQRAKDMGFDIENPVYHGTTHNIKEFDPQKGNIEGHLGKSIYFTDNPIDASGNYAGVGPDLTNKIIQRQESLINNADLSSFKSADEYGKKFGLKYKDFPDADSYFMEIAKKELAGETPSIIPAYLKMKNPLDLTDTKQGWELNVEYDDAGDFVDETGNAIDLYNAVMKVARDYDFDGQKLFNDLEIYDFKSFKDTDKALRESDELLDVIDDSGAIAANDAIKEIYKEAGFDGVILDAKKQFKNMNIPENTKHFQVFEPNQIRSQFAQFDPTKASSGNLLAGVGGLSLLAVDPQE